MFCTVDKVSLQFICHHDCMSNLDEICLFYSAGIFKDIFSAGLGSGPPVCTGTGTGTLVPGHIFYSILLAFLTIFFCVQDWSVGLLCVPVPVLWCWTYILFYSILFCWHFLKGQSHKIFDPWFFSPIKSSKVSDYHPKIVLNLVSISLRYRYRECVDSALCRIAESRNSALCRIAGVDSVLSGIALSWRENFELNSCWIA
jgi:hypothetical protein